jgi:hypothetical protein
LSALLGIHVFADNQNVDGRDKPGHDEKSGAARVAARSA